MSVSTVSNNSRPVGVRKVWESGSSHLVIVPPQAINSTSMTEGDEVLFSTDGNEIVICDVSHDVEGWVTCGVRILQVSGGSYRLTIPPRALDAIGLEAEDDIVVKMDEDSDLISLSLN